MRLRSLAALVALMTLVSVPAHAGEKSWWAWLEELSGPGYFGGPMASFPVKCWGAAREKVRCGSGMSKNPEEMHDIKTSARITVGVLTSFHRARFDNISSLLLPTAPTRTGNRCMPSLSI